MRRRASPRTQNEKPTDEGGTWCRRRSGATFSRDESGSPSRGMSPSSSSSSQPSPANGRSDETSDAGSIPSSSDSSGWSTPTGYRSRGDLSNSRQSSLPAAGPISWLSSQSPRRALPSANRSRAKVDARSHRIGCEGRRTRRSRAVVNDGGGWGCRRRSPAWGGSSSHPTSSVDWSDSPAEVVHDAPSVVVEPWLPGRCGCVEPVGDRASPQVSAAWTAASRIVTSAAANARRRTSARHVASPNRGRRAIQSSTLVANAGLPESKQAPWIHPRAVDQSSDSNAAPIDRSAG